MHALVLSYRELPKAEEVARANQTVRVLVQSVAPYEQIVAAEAKLKDAEKARNWNFSLERNRKVMGEMAGLSHEVPPGWNAGLPREEVSELLRSGKDHPVVSLSALSKYDPLCETGFCFGFATYVHWQALWQHRLHPTQIRKLWLIGETKANGVVGNFHVSTAVRDANGEWWVLDSAFSEPVTVEAWHAHWTQHSSDGMILLFPTEAKRMVPSSQGNYSRGLLEAPDWNSYFTDLISQMRGTNRGPRR